MDLSLVLNVWIELELLLSFLSEYPRLAQAEELGSHFNCLAPAHFNADLNKTGSGCFSFSITTKTVRPEEMTIGLFCGNAIVKILSSFSQGAHFILIHTDAHAVCGGAEKK